MGIKRQPCNYSLYIKVIPTVLFYHFSRSRRTWSNVETNELLKQYLKHRREMDNSTSKITVYGKILKELKRTNVLVNVLRYK